MLFAFEISLSKRSVYLGLFTSEYIGGVLLSSLDISKELEFEFILEDAVGGVCVQRS